MSESAPVAPPLPPPPPPTTVKICKTILDKDKTAAMRLPNDECSWATDYPELRKACFLNRVCQYTQPKICQYAIIDSILQIGPTCGLTALSMLLNGQPTAAELLADASAQKYTRNGEMFSAQYLYELTQKHLSSPMASEFYEGFLDCVQIKDKLSSGACLLVPYDADVNHAPCQRCGHRAHWALILGYLIDDQNEFYVVARHGKTRNLAVWSLAALSASNANLVEFAQPKGHEDLTFLLPPGGIDGDQGLRKRSVVVTNLPHQKVQVR